ncbi:hypothetical protein AX769_07925 [Frondihabitans sp. PAMC 28766]|nr:hypothetical protein AX769_07925 [Frondihabitans sp. PAMC 28766]
MDSGVLACVAGGLVATTALFMWLSDALVAPDAANLVVGGVMVVLALLTFSLSRLQLVIDRRGIRVRSRVSRMTLKFISVAEISEVRVESISPSNWGGWGYRILPSGSAIVLRTGEGIVVSRVNGKEFAVTAPNCAEGVALLAGLVESSRT